MRADYLVYTHTRPDTNEIFYVGKGTGSRANSSIGRNRYWNNIVNKAGEFKTDILAHNLTEKEALNFEALIIAKLKEQIVKLCNLTNGGEGISGYKHTEEMKEYIRTKAIGNKSHTGKKLSEQHKSNIAKSRIGYKHTEQTKKSIGKAVYCRTNGKTYNTLSSAALELNLIVSGISMCCKKALKQTGGYQFEYV
jgi:hypothetical protein